MNCVEYIEYLGCFNASICAAEGPRLFQPKHIHGLNGIFAPLTIHRRGFIYSDGTESDIECNSICLVTDCINLGNGTFIVESTCTNERTMSDQHRKRWSYSSCHDFVVKLYPSKLTKSLHRKIDKWLNRDEIVKWTKVAFDNLAHFK